MQRYGQLAMVLVMVASIALLSGCADKKRIEELQTENSQLLMDLEDCQADRDAAEAALSELRANSSEMQSRLADMQQRLAAAQQAPKPSSNGDFTVLGPGVAWLSLPDSVLFDSGKASLKGSATGKVNDVARQINSQFSGRDVFVVGHTDSDPIRKSGWKDNYELSCQRALAVARQLVQQGVPAARVVAAGCGEHRPVASNSSTGGKKSNRRVEVYAVSTPMGGGK